METQYQLHPPPVHDSELHPQGLNDVLWQMMIERTHIPTEGRHDHMKDDDAMVLTLALRIRDIDILSKFNNEDSKEAIPLLDSFLRDIVNRLPFDAGRTYCHKFYGVKISDRRFSYVPDAFDAFKTLISDTFEILRRRLPKTNAPGDRKPSAKTFL